MNETTNLTEELRTQAVQLAEELCEGAKLKAGQLVVLGSSSSEIRGSKIGSDSSLEVAEAVFGGIYEVLKAKGIRLAVQCCEHLNRAICTDMSVLKDDSEIVNVVPQLHAGGAFAVTAFKTFDNPVMVEHIKADAGIDIGDTLIGMHLKEVAVPLRVKTNRIGNARVVCARTRRKFIGGERAKYDAALM